MASGFKINKQGIAKIAKEIDKEFAKHPTRIPLETDSSGVAYPAGASTNYFGPVVQVNGDHSQLAWNNQSVNQQQVNTKQIAPGYEALAEAMVRTLQSVEAIGLPEGDSAQVETAAKEVLAEVTKPEPDRSLVQRGVNVVKGLLAGAAMGITLGVTQESQELATHVMEQIAHSF